MTKKERLQKTLERIPVGGQVPHFEISMFLTQEALGKVHPKHRRYDQWDQMSTAEKRLTMQDMAGVYRDIAEKYDYSAIFVNYEFADPADQLEFLRVLREMTRDQVMLLMHGDATWAIPDGDRLEDFVYWLADEPEQVHRQARANLEQAVRRAETFQVSGLLDGFMLCSDYCFNNGPFLSPGMFAEFVAPYLAELLAAYRQMGYYTIKHTDGNIMPILDQLVQAGPHALHSLDPQAGVDIGQVRRLVGDRVCLMGNVNCGLMQTGTPEEIAASARYALQQGMAGGGGYIFSTSNCVYTGMPLASYEQIVAIWRQEGRYPGPEN